VHLLSERAYGQRALSGTERAGLDERGDVFRDLLAENAVHSFAPYATFAVATNLYWSLRPQAVQSIFCVVAHSPVTAFATMAVAGVVVSWKELKMKSSLPPFPLRTIASHPLCPFLQRVVLTGIVKGYVRGKDFSPRYHPLGEAPSWFLALSPQRRDPVFELAAGDGVLYDTRVAAALVDEASDAVLASADLIARARERELVAHAQTVLDALRDVFTAKGGDALRESERRLFEALASVEPSLKPHGGSRFNGSSWSQVDCAYAPVFSLMLFFPRLRDASAWNELTNVRRWGLALFDHPHVQASRCEMYREEFERFFQRTGSHFPHFADHS
jgi:glutathione S-transferase